MKKEIVIIAMLVILCVIAASFGIFLHNKNIYNADILRDKRGYLKLLQDPTIKPNGDSYIGTPFFDFSLEDLNGATYKLSSIHSLMKMIIVFNPDDCNSCLNEYRLWSKLYKKYARDKLAVLAICTDRDRQSILNFVKDRNIIFPILWDPDRSIKSSMNFRKSPLRILLDQENNILEIEETLTTNEHQQYIVSMIDSRINNLMKK